MMFFILLLFTITKQVSIKEFKIFLKHIQACHIFILETLQRLTH